MIKSIILPFFAFVLLPVGTSAQLDIDSLLTEIENYVIIDSVPLDDSIFIKTYTSSNSTQRYEICQNLKGEIVNPSQLGFAIHYMTVDQMGRETVRAYYSANGTLKNIPSIGRVLTQTVYFDSISMEQINYIYGDGSIELRIERFFDKKRRVIDRRVYDGDLNLQHKAFYEFDDNLNTRTTKIFDSESNLMVNECGGAIEVIKYPESGFTENSIDWLEERMYNSEMELVDCYRVNGFDKPYAILNRTPISGSKFRVVLLNAKKEILFDDTVQY